MIYEDPSCVQFVTNKVQAQIRPMQHIHTNWKGVEVELRRKKKQIGESRSMLFLYVT